MLESEQVVTRSKVNIILVLVTIGIVAISSVAIGYFYIQNTMLENDKAYLQDEISTSYESGYDAGYDYGNQSGYLLGFHDGNEISY